MVEFFEKLFFVYENTFWRKTLQSQDFLTHYTCGDCYGSTKDLTKTMLFTRSFIYSNCPGNDWGGQRLTFAAKISCNSKVGRKFRRISIKMHRLYQLFPWQGI